MKYEQVYKMEYITLIGFVGYSLLKQMATGNIPSE